MNTRYDTMYDGEWHPMKKKNQRIQCCHCRLTHVEEYRVKNGVIECRCWVDLKATAAARKRAGISLATKTSRAAKRRTKKRR